MVGSLGSDRIGLVFYRRRLESVFVCWNFGVWWHRKLMMKMIYGNTGTKHCHGVFFMYRTVSEK